MATCNGDHVIITRRCGRVYRECLCGHKEVLVARPGEAEWVTLRPVEPEPPHK
jgi:hypothetical protein